MKNALQDRIFKKLSSDYFQIIESSKFFFFFLNIGSKELNKIPNLWQIGFTSKFRNFALLLLFWAARLFNYANNPIFISQAINNVQMVQSNHNKRLLNKNIWGTVQTVICHIWRKIRRTLNPKFSTSETTTATSWIKKIVEKKKWNFAFAKKQFKNFPDLLLNFLWYICLLLERIYGYFKYNLNMDAMPTHFSENCSPNTSFGAEGKTLIAQSTKNH